MLGNHAFQGRVVRLEDAIEVEIQVMVRRRNIGEACLSGNVIELEGYEQP